MASDASRQISLRLPGRLLDRLDDEARARRLERSELVRELIETALSGAPPERPWDRVSDLVGRYGLGVPDLGAKHREHLGDLLRERERGRR